MSEDLLLEENVTMISTIPVPTSKVEDYRHVMKSIITVHRLFDV